MRELIVAAAGMVLQLAVFFCIGSLVMYGLKMKAEASLAVVLGFLAYFALFELIAVPMTLVLVPLKVLTIVWAVLMAVLVCAAVALLHRQWKTRLIGAAGEIRREHSVWILAAAAAVGLQCLIVVLFQDVAQDAAYYVGTVSTSVYTGTLGRFDPFTGNALKKFQARYILSAFPMNNAVWCNLLGLPALIQCKVVMSAINVLVANLTVYQIGKKLFHGGKKQADLMICFVCLLNLFSDTIYMSGAFFFTRSYEGKMLLANISIPVALFAALWLWQLWNEKKTTGIGTEKCLPAVPGEERNVWIMLFLASASAVCFSGSAIIYPAAISAGVLPLILIKRKWKKLIPYILCMLPNIIHAGIYLCAALKLITLKAV